MGARSRTAVVGLVAILMGALPVAAGDVGVQAVPALREALRISVERGLANVARPGGFADNVAIRIPLPDQFERMEAAFRVAGEQKRLDRFVTGLSQVAEQTAAVTRPVLLTSVSELPIDGARLLAGGGTAATDALRRYSLGRVLAALDGAVADTMEAERVTRRFRRLSREAPMGMLAPPSFDLDAYVTGRTADGIYFVIGQEERRIRTDPTARTTPLLREVFGNQR